MYQPQQDYPIQHVHHPAPLAADRRRRQTLGIVLLMLGTAWLTLRLTGQIGALPMPICAIDPMRDMLQHLHLGCGDPTAMGYGMLWMIGV